VLSKIPHLTLIFFVISLAQCAYAKTPNQAQIKVCKKKITECTKKKPREAEKCLLDLPKESNNPECKEVLRAIAKEILCHEELKSSKCAKTKNVKNCVEKHTRKMFKTPNCYDFFTKKTRIFGRIAQFFSRPAKKIVSKVVPEIIPDFADFVDFTKRKQRRNTIGLKPEPERPQSAARRNTVAVKPEPEPEPPRRRPSSSEFSSSEPRRPSSSEPRRKSTRDTTRRDRDQYDDEDEECRDKHSLLVVIFGDSLSDVGRKAIDAPKLKYIGQIETRWSSGNIWADSLYSSLTGGRKSRSEVHTQKRRKSKRNSRDVVRKSVMGHMSILSKIDGKCLYYGNYARGGDRATDEEAQSYSGALKQKYGGLASSDHQIEEFRIDFQKRKFNQVKTDIIFIYWMGSNDLFTLDNIQAYDTTIKVLNGYIKRINSLSEKYRNSKIIVPGLPFPSSVPVYAEYVDRLAEEGGKSNRWSEYMSKKKKLDNLDSNIEIWNADLRSISNASKRGSDVFYVDIASIKCKSEGCWFKDKKHPDVKGHQLIWGKIRTRLFLALDELGWNSDYTYRHRRR